MLFPELFRKWADMIEKDPSTIEVELDTYSVATKGVRDAGQRYEAFTLNVNVDAETEVEWRNRTSTPS